MDAPLPHVNEPVTIKDELRIVDPIKVAVGLLIVKFGLFKVSEVPVVPMVANVPEINQFCVDENAILLVPKPMMPFLKVFVPLTE